MLFVSAKPLPAVNRGATQKTSRPWVRPTALLRAGPIYKSGKLLGSRGDRQQCQCLEKTGRNYQLGARWGQSGHVGGWEGRGDGNRSVLVLTDNIEGVNQRVKLIPYTLQGVTDHLRAVQELDAVGVGLVFHREGPLDVRRVAPAREGCRRLGVRDESWGSLLPSSIYPGRSQQVNASFRQSFHLSSTTGS